MTLSAGNARDEYTSGASQTVFNYTFKIYSSTDLDVYVTPAGQACSDSDLTTSYTVSGVGSESGGAITLITPASSGDLVTIVSSIPTSRTTDYQNNGDFRTDTVNDDFDRVVSLTKQTEDIANRSLQFPPCEQGVTALSLPTPAAGAYVRWRQDVSGLENVTISGQGIQNDVSVVNYAALRALTSADYSDGQVIYVTNNGVAGEFIVKTGTVTDNGGTLIVFTDDSNRYAERILNGGVVDAKMFGAPGTTGNDSTDGLTAFFAWLGADSKNSGIIGQGVFEFDTTITLSTRERTITGVYDSTRRTGNSTDLATTLSWTGGATPMFTSTVGQHKFSNLAVRSNGSATCFQEMPSSSAQTTWYDNVFFTTRDMFTQAVILCTENPIGYSKFSFVRCNDTAPAFIDIDGNGFSNGCTPIRFEHCQFSNDIGTGGTGATPWTIVLIDDVVMEAITFEDCTVISHDGVVMVDNSTDPRSEAMSSLVLHDCEIDNYTGAALSMFILHNTVNISVVDNVISGEAANPDHMFDLTNCKVSRVEGNQMQNVNYMLDADSSTLVRGVGSNHLDWSTCQGITESLTAGLAKYTQTAAETINLDASSWGPAEVALFEVEITTSDNWTLNLSKAQPRNWEPGQVFIVTLKNTSGGAGGTISKGSNMQFSTWTPPANGTNNQVMFRFNGDEGLQIATQSQDFTNTI